MKRSILIGLFVTICFSSFSQTKRIAHRSHSGNSNTFSLSGGDNFGLPPKVDSTKEIKPVAKTDSVKKVKPAYHRKKRKQVTTK